MAKKITTTFTLLCGIQGVSVKEFYLVLYSIALGTLLLPPIELCLTLFYDINKWPWPSFNLDLILTKDSKVDLLWPKINDLYLTFLLFASMKRKRKHIHINCQTYCILRMKYKIIEIKQNNLWHQSLLALVWESLLHFVH